MVSVAGEGLRADSSQMTQLPNFVDAFKLVLLLYMFLVMKMSMLRTVPSPVPCYYDGEPAQQP